MIPLGGLEEVIRLDSGVACSSVISSELGNK